MQLQKQVRTPGSKSSAKLTPPWLCQDRLTSFDFLFFPLRIFLLQTGIGGQKTVIVISIFKWLGGLQALGCSAPYKEKRIKSWPARHT